MLTIQARLPLVLPMRARQRRVRRPFHPPLDRSPYRLPHEVRDRLSAALASFRNREAAFALASFIARFWSGPGRGIEGFYIDRRELAGREDLGLTEAQVRSAIRVLEEVGFLDRAPTSGSKYKATEDGLRRKPIRFMFGADYARAFIKANERAATARSGSSRERRAILPSETTRRSSPSPALKSPKYKSEANLKMYLGDLKNEQKSSLPQKPFDPNPKLEAALDRLLQGIQQSRSGQGNGARS